MYRPQKRKLVRRTRAASTLVLVVILATGFGAFIHRGDANITVLRSSPTDSARSDTNQSLARLAPSDHRTITVTTPLLVDSSRDDATLIQGN